MTPSRGSVFWPPMRSQRALEDNHHDGGKRLIQELLEILQVDLNPYDELGDNEVEAVGRLLFPQLRCMVLPPLRGASPIPPFSRPMFANLQTNANLP